MTVGDVTEQTDNADDAMAVEDGLRDGLGPHGGRNGAGAASGGEPADGRTWGEDGSPPSGACACGAGGGDGSRAMERASGKAGSASGAGRAEGAAWAGAGGRSLCNTCRGGGLVF